MVTGSSRLNQLFLGARGTGKTHCLALKGLFLGCRNPGRKREDGSWQYTPGAFLGRTMREVDDKIEPEFQEHVRRFKDSTGINLVAWYNKKHQRYTLVNGAQIYKLSYGRADALRKVRGYTLGWALVDEIEHAEVDSHTTFVIVGATLRHALATEPVLGLFTTPAGLRGVTAHFAKMLRSGDPEYYAQTATVYDNPYVDERFRERLRRGCSPRQWAEEGLGKILRPSEVIYGDYSPQRHVIPWEWDRNLPYIIAVDWGEGQAYFCSIQIQRDGRWVVAREKKMEDGSRPRFRDMILREVRTLGYPPWMFAADRAVRSENNWLRGTFGDVCQHGIQTLEKRDHYKRSWGIGAVSYMLAPDMPSPRLYFSSELSGHLEMAGRGIRGSMLNYRYQRRRLDTGERVITNRPEENTPNTHPCDALRYAVGCSAWMPELHGGEVLPFALAHSIKDEFERAA